MDTKLEIFNGAYSRLWTHLLLWKRSQFGADPDLLSVKISRTWWCPGIAFITVSFEGDALDWKNFKESRDSVKRRLSKAERKYTSEEVQLHKHNLNSLWKIINRVIPSKNQERLTFSKDLKTTANEFNRYFSSVGRNANASIHLAEDKNITLPEPTRETVPLLPNELFRLRTVTREDVNSPCHFISPVDQVSWFRQSKCSYNQRLPSCHIRSYHRDYQLLHYYEHISNNMEDGRSHTYPQRRRPLGSS